MTLQDTRTPQQMMQDFYGQANVNVPHYNGRYQEEQKNKRMASEVFFPTFNQPFGGGSQRPSDGSFGIEDTPLNRQVFPEAFGSRFGIAGGPSLLPIGSPLKEDSTEAEKALGGFEDKGALNRFNKVHPAGGMPAPGGTGIGSKVYDFLQSIGFGTK